jgi:diaminopimelate epimerase
MNKPVAKKIKFYKMSGSGNDFVIIDNRDLSLDVGDISAFVRRVCARKVSVGADGLLLIEPSKTADFKWQFFNSDGSVAEMCGNAARCVAFLAYLKKIAGKNLSFETLAGIIDAEINGNIPKVKLTDPSPVKVGEEIIVDNRKFDAGVVNTGVPHAVIFMDELELFDVFTWGRKIRYHEKFQPKGANANFTQVLDRHRMKVRTYERGVEDETLACGTGDVAAVLVAAQKNLVDSPVEVIVRSGETLRVHFTNQNGHFNAIYLEGRVKIVYQGTLFEEAYKD